MNFKKIALVSALAALSVGAFAQANFMGIMFANSTYYSDGGTGPFAWEMTNQAGTASFGAITTYCMSAAGNDFNPGEKPQWFAVYAIGNNLPDVALDALTARNDEFNGQTATQAETDFMEAVWYSEYYGPADATNGATSRGLAMSGAGGINDNIHQIEAGSWGGSGNAGITAQFGSEAGLEADAVLTGNSYWYLDYANPSNYGNAGQPQGLVFSGGGPNTQLTPEPFTIALSLAGLGFAVRRRRMAKR